MHFVRSASKLGQGYAMIIEKNKSVKNEHLFIPRNKTHHQKNQNICIFIHPQAVIIGNVEIGEEVYIIPMLFCVEIGAKSLSKTAQTFKKTVRFTFSGIPTILEESAHIGHGAIIHSAHIGKIVWLG